MIGLVFVSGVLVPSSAKEPNGENCVILDRLDYVNDVNGDCHAVFVAKASPYFEHESGIYYEKLLDMSDPEFSDMSEPSLCTMISNIGAKARNPQITIDQLRGVIHCVWQEDIDNSVFYAHSSSIDGGSTWAASNFLDDSPKAHGGFDLSVEENNLTIKIQGKIIQIPIPDIQTSSTFSIAEPIFKEVNGYDSVQLIGSMSTGNPGAPAIPAISKKIILPPGSTIQNLQTIFTDMNFKHDVNLIPCQESKPWGELEIEVGEEKNYTVPDEAIYSSTEMYPGHFNGVPSIQHFRGYDVLFLNLFPVQYYPANQTLVFVEELEISFNIVAGTPSPLFRGGETDEEEVQTKVDDALSLPAYDLLSAQEEPTTGYVNPAEAHQHVIITKSDFVEAFEPLRAWKESQYDVAPFDFSSTIVTIENIYANYGGIDHQEQIRNFIIDAYQNWDAKYILLGGDVTDDNGDELIPCRYFKTENTPSDLYYGTLDGNWDTDNDGIYGEDSFWNDGVEEADLLAEVYVGRAPCGNSNEATIFSTKTISYESGDASQSQNKMLLLGGMLNSYLDIGGEMNKIFSETIPFWYDLTVLDESSYFRTGKYELTDSNVINELENGQAIVNHVGHANNHDLGLSLFYYENEQEGLFEPHIDNLTNNPNLCLFYSLSCWSNAFDEEQLHEEDSGDALSEHFINNPNGGSYAYIGNTRYGWSSSTPGEGASERFNIEFYKVLFEDNIINLGKTLQESKEPFANIVLACEGKFREVYYGLNLLGDPHTPVHIKSQAEHDVAVTEIKPDYFNLDSGAERIIGTISNVGLTDETNFLINLYVNGIFTETAMVNQLLSGDSLDIEFLWIPPSEGLYTVEVNIDPVSGEISEDQWNNEKEEIIQAKNIKEEINVAVLDSSGTDWGSWPILLSLSDSWFMYGDYKVTVDTVSLNKEDITYEDIQATNADVLMLSHCDPMYWKFTNGEIEAITKYVSEGHGIIGTGWTLRGFGESNEQLSPIFGLDKGDAWGFRALNGELVVLDKENELFQKLPTYYQINQNTISLSISLNESSPATIVACSSDIPPVPLVFTHLGGITGNGAAVYLNYIPENDFLPNNNQLIYNSFVWAFNNMDSGHTDLKAVSGTGNNIDFIDIEWSPNGEQAIILGHKTVPPYENKVFTYDKSGFNEIYSSSKTLYSVSWRPDGAEALITGAPDLVLKYSSGIITSILTSTLNYNFYDVDYSTLEPYIAFLSGEASGQSAYATYDGSLNCYINPAYSALFSASWHPSGDYVLIDSYSSSELYRYSYPSGLIETITTPWNDGGFWMDWHPSGEYALIPVMNSGVWKYLPGTIEDSDVFIKIYNDNEYVLRIKWDSVGDFALLVGESGKALIFDGTAITPLVSGTNNNLLSATWRPDSNSALLVGAGDTVLQFRGDIIPTGTDYFLYGAEWKPDGEYCLIVGYSETEPFVPIILKYDGKVIYPIAIGSPTGLNMFLPRILTGISWRPDGEIALISGFNQVFSYDTMTESISEIYRGNGNFYKPEWIPDMNPLTEEYEGYCLMVGFTAMSGGITAICDGINAPTITYYGAQISSAMSVKWRPQGDYALITTQHPYIPYKYIETTGTLEALPSPGTIFGWRSDWHPSGEYALLAAYSEVDGGSISRFDMSSETFTSVIWPMNDERPFSLSWNLEGTRCLIVGDNCIATTEDGLNFDSQNYLTPNLLLSATWRSSSASAIIVGENGTLIEWASMNP